MTENMDKFELGIAVSKYMILHGQSSTDWYIELVKQRLYSEDSISKDAALYTLTYVLERFSFFIRLCHLLLKKFESYMEKKEKKS